MAKCDPEKQRRFAVELVAELRQAGFEAYWAGGCVRDQLLKHAPKDYDVATNATPDDIRRVFPRRRTIAIGVSFGVITVVGPRGAGQIEVATFRRDFDYEDGRRPNRVEFSSAEEDAKRRDFTINGLFYDPLEDRVLDFVGGREDLDRGVVRAIGDPAERFAEDKLRMLRAVRFAAVFGFQLDSATGDVIRQMADEIAVVSPERIAMEMRRMLTEHGRVLGVQLMLATNLANVVLPEILDIDAPALNAAFAVLRRLDAPSFPLALAALLGSFVGPEEIRAIGRRWRLANDETNCAAWLVENRGALAGAAAKPWSVVQPILINPWAAELVALHDAAGGDRHEVAWCRDRLAQPREALDPAPLLTGDDLQRAGFRPGPAFRKILAIVRDAQLDGTVHTSAEALTLAQDTAKNLEPESRHG